MIPRIIVFDTNERDALMEYLGVKDDKLLSVEGGEVKVGEFRKWVNNTMAVLYGKPTLRALIWDADLLSVECQSVLLKPLEELSENSQIVLVVSNENGLLSTILSRCVVEKVALEVKAKKDEDELWLSILNAWKKGPSECLRLSESADLERAKEVVDLVINKMANSFQNGVNQKRIEVTKQALIYESDLKQKNINFKLVLGDFLLQSWMQIGS